LANELKLPITVCHLPPGTSKWNKVEHRLFSFISMNWHGTGLTVRAELNENKYPKGIVSVLVAAINWTTTAAF
jgi:hypothetical protein